MNYDKVLTDKIAEEILSKGVRDMPQNPSAQGYSERQVRGFYYIPEQEILNVIKKIEDVLEETLKNVINVDTELNLNSKNALSNEKTTQELYRRGLFGSEAPTTKTKGELGQIYTNSNNGDRFVCIAINSSGYNWIRISTSIDINNVKNDVKDKIEQLDSKTSKATNVVNGSGEYAVQLDDSSDDEVGTNTTNGRGGLNLGRYGILDTRYGLITGYYNMLLNRTGGSSLNACGIINGTKNYGRGLHLHLFGIGQLANTYSAFMFGFSDTTFNAGISTAADSVMYTDENGKDWTASEVFKGTLSDSEISEILYKAWIQTGKKFQCVVTPAGPAEVSNSVVIGINNFCWGYTCTIDGSSNYIGKNNHGCSIKGRNCEIFDVELTESGAKNNHACINLIGDGLKTYGNTEGGMTIIGSFNKYDKTKDGIVKFQIGNGKSDAERSNALTVYEDGTVEIGDTTINKKQLKALLNLIK